MQIYVNNDQERRKEWVVNLRNFNHEKYCRNSTFISPSLAGRSLDRWCRIEKSISRLANMVNTRAEEVKRGLKGEDEERNPGILKWRNKCSSSSQAWGLECFLKEILVFPSCATVRSGKTFQID